MRRCVLKSAQLRKEGLLLVSRIRIMKKCLKFFSHYLIASATVILWRNKTLTGWFLCLIKTMIDAIFLTALRVFSLLKSHTWPHNGRMEKERETEQAKCTVLRSVQLFSVLDAQVEGKILSWLEKGRNHRIDAAALHNTERVKRQSKLVRLLRGPFVRLKSREKFRSTTKILMESGISLIYASLRTLHSSLHGRDGF